ncbi:hypothetical protein BDZ45DRAFT_786068 [Acephala macrosclerotiorum]|nr:hypothetical protein BDZ45DRAFT_786068 [Acephala macrosclerotiorum]
MGTTLSVVNDTDCRWSCRLGPDEAAVDVFAKVATAVGIAASVIATAGQAAPLAATLVANGVTSVVGISTAGAATITTAAAGAAGAAKAIDIAIAISASCTAAAAEEMKKKGYVDINPGSRFNWNDLSASLWQQCHCTRTWYDAVQEEVVTEHVFMRPIFSAAEVGKTAEHCIQWWKNKGGHFTVERKRI